MALAGYIFYLEGRAGWIGTTTSVLFVLNNRKAVFEAPQKKMVLVPAFLIFIFLISLFVKPRSTEGRIHIYKISFAIIKDHWLKGTGTGRFKAVFNEYQASYFENNAINSKRALLADNTFYAFNDYLQWIAETGITGFLFLITLFISFIGMHKRIRQRSDELLPVSAFSTLISIAVAALFSYPLQVTVIQLLVLGCTGIILLAALRTTDNKNVAIRVLRILLIASWLTMISSLFLKVITELKQRDSEKEAFFLATRGYKMEALAEYEKLSSHYPKSGYPQLLYAELLYYSGRIADAWNWLHNSKRFYISDKTYKLQAQIETEMRLYKEAESSLRRVVFMVPNRMRSRYELMRFYLSRSDTTNAKHWANSILAMPVKVPSEETNQMMKQAAAIAGY